MQHPTLRHRAGLSRWTVYKRHQAAETRLVEAIRSGVLSEPATEVITEATLTTAPDPEAYDRR